MSSAVVTVGVRVENQSEYQSLHQAMFHCRQRDRRTVDWAREAITYMPPLVEQNRLKLGEVRRYWVRLEIIGSFDYFGEYDEEVRILKIRRAK